MNRNHRFEENSRDIPASDPNLKHSPYHNLPFELAATADGPLFYKKDGADSQAGYLDWASNILLDSNLDLLSSYDFAVPGAAQGPLAPIMRGQVGQAGQVSGAASSLHTGPGLANVSGTSNQQNSNLGHGTQVSSVLRHLGLDVPGSMSGSIPGSMSGSMSTMSGSIPPQSVAPMGQVPGSSLSGPMASMPGANLRSLNTTPIPVSPYNIPKADKTPLAFKTSKYGRPCDHCRRRKTRCVFIPGTVNCVQCAAKSQRCTYVNTASAREPDSKRARLSSDYSGTHSVEPPNVPIRTVQPVHDYSSMNNSLLKKTLSLQFPRSSFYIGPTSYLFDVNLLDVIIATQNKDSERSSSSISAPNQHATVRSSTSPLNKIEQVNLSDSISLRKVSHRTQFVLKDDQSKNSYQTMSNDVDAIEKFVTPHGQTLIDLYFRIIHPSYPILHKKVFLEKYSRTHREFSAPLLAAVYVLAIQWWDYDPQLNRYPKPNVAMILKIALNNYILEILKRPKLSAVQAGLLLLECKHILGETAPDSVNPVLNAVNSASASLNSSFTDSNYNDWVLCSQVVSLSEELGLGLDCDDWKLPKWERGLRKRLAWAVYLEDKWLAVKNSRPSHINEINWIVKDLAEEDFPEKHGDGDLKEGSSDITNGKKIFMNFIELSSILSEILSSFYSMRAMKEITDINEVLKIAKPIQLKLRTWYHSLPPEIHMNSVQPRKLCANGYLQLAYFATELTLHRRIVTTLYQQTQAGATFPDELVNVCRTAAKTRLLAAIEFVRDLKPEHIHSFWHSSSSCNFALIGTFAGLLFISSTSREESDFYKEHIFNYRWILKISSKGFVQVGDALNKLDLVMNHIPGLLTEDTESKATVPPMTQVDLEKIYLQPLNLLPALLQLPGHGLSGSSGSPLSQPISASSHISGPPPTRPVAKPNGSERSGSWKPTGPYSINSNEQTSGANGSNSFRATGSQHGSPRSSQGVSPECVRQKLQPYSQNGYSDRATPSENGEGPAESPVLQMNRGDV